MKILALDSSGLVASVAVVEDERLLGEYTINYKKTHSQTLLPMLDELVKNIELELGSVDAIAVAAGPGSFTGLRIGSATAKGLGLALNKPIISVPTIDGLAFNLWGCADLICPILDARRQQVYTGLYQFQGDEFCNIIPQDAMSIENLVQILNEKAQNVVFLGDGVPVFADYLREHCKVTYRFAPAHCNMQRGASVAALGARLYAQGKFEDAAEHKPEYLRKSQAEREREERERDFTVGNIV